MTSTEWKKQIKEILNKKENKFCADCGKPNPDWGVYNLGIFVCIDCSGIHREMGVDISKVKSCVLDAWGEEHLSMVRNKGNTLMNEQFERNMPCYHFTPREVYIDAFKKAFLIDKYKLRKWYSVDEQKNNPCVEESPVRLTIGVFYLEQKKTKVFLQILGDFLHYFKNNHDSYSNEKYNIKNLKCCIELNEDDVVILEIKSPNETIFRLRCLKKNNGFDELINFGHSIRKSVVFYCSKYAPNVRLSKANGKPLSVLTKKDVEKGEILGYASKKGGGARGYKKRWWVLLEDYLYYFKDNFTKNKKNPNSGTPQGNIALYGADVAWDVDKNRTGKNNVFLLATYDRCFYIQPDSSVRDTFFKTLETACLKLWPRIEVDYTTLKL